MKVSCEDVNGPRSSLGRAWNHVSWLYYQYLLVTALYMLEPWERTVFSILSAYRVTQTVYSANACVPCALFPVRLSGVVTQQQVVFPAQGSVLAAEYLNVVISVQQISSRLEIKGGHTRADKAADIGRLDRFDSLSARVWGLPTGLIFNRLTRWSPLAHRNSIVRPYSRTFELPPI
ncbi:hypothetical protein XELAEV_18040028mg [Xenopus laevis]|uniref:Uncharacterized protein n=1 Tax=Xenopus laevis TaxID=8355 RepID=A0A974C8N6_XENLA|nr:hypothetical protein XELAEV_18040028mg [Xenopus laevis]